MSEMTELDFVIEGFELRFHKFKGKKIILHGTREYAQHILNEFDSEYYFAAVMTNEDISEDQFCGKPIIQPGDIARLSADLVILTERVKYECAAYDTIKKICSDLGIIVLDMYGVDIEKVYRDYQNSYRSIEEDEKIVRDHDIIIFEAVDTFLARRGDKLIPILRSKSIYRYAKENGKTIYFSLRKSYPEKDQIDALIRNRIISDENDPALIRRQGEDLSLRIIAENHKGRRMVYYGSGFAYEFLLPRYYGIDSYNLVIPFFNSLTNIVSASDSENGFFSDSLSTITELIKSHDVISFDVFDTLVTRKILEPWDIFNLMRERLKRSQGMDIEQFIVERKLVQQEYPHENIMQFYKIIQTRLGLTEDQRDRLMDEELSIEKELIVRRESVCGLLKYAKEIRKKVVLTSDMYIPRDMLSAILHNVGISDWDELLVSCDYGTSKNQDLFGILRNKYPTEKIFHLGNDIRADILPTARFSIRSILIPSGLEMAKQCGWGEVLNSIDNMDEKNLMGLIISRVFNDPFIPAEYPLLDRHRKMERFAIGACTPMILGYLFWLEVILCAEKYEKLLLFSRDGYILNDLYEELRERSRMVLPEGMYFYSNRHSAFLLCADDESYQKSVLEVYSQGRPAVDMFSSLFGYYPEDISDDLSEMFEKNKEKISSFAKQQKENFGKYLEKSGINAKSCYAVMDFVSSGKTLDFITKGAGLDFHGFFFFQRNSPFIAENKIRAYLDRNTSCFFVDCFMEMEHIMTSPESALDHFDELGKPVFAEEVRSQSDISDILYMQNLIKKTASEYIRHFYHDGLRINSLFATESYAADGLHGIMKEAFDDWAKEKLI